MRNEKWLNENDWIFFYFFFIYLLIFYFIIIIFFFDSVSRLFQDLFSSYETGQSVAGAKTGEPREKPDTPASRTWLVSHVAHTGHSGEMIAVRKYQRS